MHDFWFGFFVGFVVLTILCVIGVCCIVVGSRSERPAQGCGGCDAVRRDELIARVCKERDELKKENEKRLKENRHLAFRVVRLLNRIEQMEGKPRNTYEELERSWEKV